MILDEICANKREEVTAAKAKVSLDDLKETIKGLAKPRDFRFALRKEGISLIAEVKKASPTKGRLRPDGDLAPSELSALYEHAGARAISVLTDEKYFAGSLDDLAVVRKTVEIPCLRKDFVVDPYQIYEARAWKADAILLIVRVLSDEELKEFLKLAHDLQMAALVETHTAEEVERALKADAHIIGINNRDLSTFEVDINTTLELKKIVPGGCVLVSESGIRTREEVQRLEDSGIDAVLIGEVIVTSNNVRGTINELLGNA
ncbi:MAG: indole-3-glycerol phosphate synthase TrpC [Candidatus Hydrogenedentes bacterium]|nr:indole-3-glycerol phosphate synthase TrpC [Candidatus Hydrogenedentota bacterium]